MVVYRLTMIFHRAWVHSISTWAIYNSVTLCMFHCYSWTTRITNWTIPRREMALPSDGLVADIESSHGAPTAAITEDPAVGVESGSVKTARRQRVAVADDTRRNDTLADINWRRTSGRSESQEESASTTRNDDDDDGDEANCSWFPWRPQRSGTRMTPM